MKKKAIILDLDNTIYPVLSIGEELFKSLFDLIYQRGEYAGDFEVIRREIMRKPFQKVAAEFSFSKALTAAGIKLLENLTFNKQMYAFEDYAEVRNISGKKFLVTTGFTRLQQSKIKQLGIANDFEEIHIVDPKLSNQTKKDIFKSILERYQYQPAEVLVVGDDPDSEIKAALDLGIDAVLYDKVNFNPDVTTLNRITDFKQLEEFV